MNRIVVTFGIALLVLAASAANVCAVDIFSNLITDPNPSTFNPFTAGQTFDANMTATGLGRGPGINPNAGSNRYNATAWSLAASGFDANDYFTFTLTPNSGYEIDFASVSGQWQRSSTGPLSYLLKTSLDSFVAPIASGGISGSGSAVSYNLDLSSLQDVASEIEIRLYAFGGSGGSGTFSFNDFTFDGSVNQVSGPITFAGDYNDDGVIDSGDYAIWRKSSTDNSLLPANETVSPGIADSADYDEWRANFGNSEIVGGGSSLSTTGTTVPEPPSVVLLLLAIAAAFDCFLSRRQLAKRAARFAA